MSDFFVHESSYVDPGVTIGENTKIWYFCHLQSGAVIGKNCSFGQNVNIAGNVPHRRRRQGAEQRFHL